MFGMALDSIKLFLLGKLFRDKWRAFGMWLIGFVIGLVVLFVVAWLAGAWAGVIGGGLVGGASMPLLFRNLKFN